MRFNIFSDESTLKLLSKIERNSIDLSHFVYTSLGITPYDKHKGHDVETIKKRSYHSLIKLNDSYVPLISGKNIHPYCISNEIKEYLKYGEWLGAPRDKKFFINEKIIVRQIVGNGLRIIAGYSNKSHFFTQVGFSLIPKNNSSLDLKVLLAILNSSLISFYHKEKFLDTQKTVFQKILISNAKRIPIKMPYDKTYIVAIVNRILTAKRIDPNTDTSLEELKIDFLIYKLYNLTYDEVKIVDPETLITKEEYETMGN